MANIIICYGSALFVSFWKGEMWGLAWLKRSAWKPWH